MLTSPTNRPLKKVVPNGGYSHATTSKSRPFVLLHSLTDPITPLALQNTLPMPLLTTPPTNTGVPYLQQPHTPLILPIQAIKTVFPMSRTARTPTQYRYGGAVLSRTKSQSQLSNSTTSHELFISTPSKKCKEKGKKNYIKEDIEVMINIVGKILELAKNE